MADENVPPVSPPPVTPPPVTPPPGAPAGGPTPPSGPGPAPAKRSSKTWIIVAVVAVLLLCCLCSAAGGAFYYIGSQKQTESTSGTGSGGSTATGTVTGRVSWERQDDTVIYQPNATVVLTNSSDSAVTFQATSDENGRYSIENVTPGTYEVKCVILKSQKGQVDKSWHIKNVSVTSGKETIEDLTFQNSDNTFNPN